MLKYRYVMLTRIGYFVGLIGLPLLLNGCVTHYYAEQERLRNQLELEQKALAKEKAALEQRQREVEQKLTRLNREAEQLASARASLAQENRKLEVLKRSLNATEQSVSEGESQYQKIESIIVGQIEPVVIDPPGLTLNARIDTGAETSSLNAMEMTAFERDGKPYVSFKLKHPDTGEMVEITRRILKHKKIKDHGNGYQRRPVVKMRAVLGNIDQRIEFTLADRSNFKYQVLIGRNFLSDFAIVDVSRRFLTKPDSP